MAQPAVHDSFHEWNDEALDAMRQVGDAPADLVVKTIYERGQLAAVNDLVRTLVTADTPTPRELPPLVRDYFLRTEVLPAWTDRDLLLTGQRVFVRHVALCTLALNCASLPGSYLAHPGVKAVHRTTRMLGDPRRRIVETAQLVFDVMRPGGLDARGAGIRSAQKVRLMHSAIRHQLLEHGWDVEADGFPINQEDLGGVLVAFSVAVTESIQRLGVDLTDEEKEGFFHVWRVVGHVLGLDPAVLPDDYADAIRLGEAIERRHFARSTEGVELTAALIEMLEEAVPGELFDAAPVVLMRHLLEDRRADMLDIPRVDATGPLLAIARKLFGSLDELTDRSPVLARVAEELGEAVLGLLIRVERGPRRVAFRMPESLRARLEEPAREPVAAWLADVFNGIRQRLPEVRLASRNFAIRAPYPWFPFATRFRDDDGVVGAEFFREFSRRVNARFQGPEAGASLMDDFDELRSPDFEPYEVAPVIREFYENTSRFDLSLKVEWSRLFDPIRPLYRDWIARRIGTFDFPAGVVEDLDSWVELIDVDRDGRPDYRAWVRVHGDERSPMWVGAYKIYRAVNAGEEAGYISVAFPTPGGNLTTVLYPENWQGNGLRLSTRTRQPSDAGLYQILPGPNSFSMFPAYGLHEVFELAPTTDGQGIDVEHVSRWFGLEMFTMRYKIRPERKRDPAKVEAFCDAVRRGRRSGGPPPREEAHPARRSGSPPS